VPDVALRLGKIIEQRLPGADVVYTRSDDSFIPGWKSGRTSRPGQGRPNFFDSRELSRITQPAALRRILNLKGSADAMEVAARENASSQEGVHDCRDLV